MQVKDIMKKDIITFNPDDTIKQVSEKLSKNNISGAPVVDNGKLVGIISELDIIGHIRKTSKEYDMVFIPTSITNFGIIDFKDVDIKNIDEAYLKVSETPVSKLMKRDIISTKPEELAKNAATLMVDNKINRIPVVDDEKLVGIVTRGDIIKGVTLSGNLLKDDE